MSQSAEYQFNIQIGDELTQNVKPLLHEIKHALDALITKGDTSIIDLRSIPLAPGEEDKLLHVLGRGEIKAQLNAMGLSDIVETKYAGVWIVTHYNDEESIVGRFIEITKIPDIMSSQHQDMLAAYDDLSDDLERDY